MHYFCGCKVEEYGALVIKFALVDMKGVNSPGKEISGASISNGRCRGHGKLLTVGIVLNYMPITLLLS